MRWQHFFILLLLLSAPSRATDMINVPAVLALETPTFSLSDLLPGALPINLRQRLQGYAMGPVPRYGTDLVLRPASIQFAWTRAAGPVASQWLLHVPPQVLIRWAGGVPAGPRLALLARERLQAALSPRCARLVLQVRDGLATLVLPAKGLTLRARLPQLPRMARRMRVWVDVDEGDARYRSLPLWFDVACYQKVLRLKQDKQQGQHLLAEEVIPAEEDVATMAQPPAQLAEGAVLRHDLAAGSVLTAVDMVPAVLVRMGEKVRLRVRDGSVALELAGEALGDASLDQVVLVKSTLSTRAVSARVSGPGVLDVQ